MMYTPIIAKPANHQPRDPVEYPTKYINSAKNVPIIEIRCLINLSDIGLKGL